VSQRLDDCDPTSLAGIEKSFVMPRVRDIVSATRAAAVWLLAIVVFFGPAGLASAAYADACGSMCPCDQAEESDDCDDEEPADGSAPDEECPRDCSSCACSPGVAMTMVAWTMPMSPPSAPALALAPRDVAAAGVCTGVFRPPRSRI
jgi:hypothetical protein